MARKKRRSAKQIAATKKLVAWGKKHRGKKRRKTSTAKKVYRKKRNPVRKKRAVVTYKKSGRAIGAASSRLWLVFACKGKTVVFLTFNANKLSNTWTKHKGKASLFKEKKQAMAIAKSASKIRAFSSWQIGGTKESTTATQIQAACSKK